MGVPNPNRGSIRTIGANGRISLGKHLAGRQVLVEEPEPGVWLIRTATVVPDNERWLQTPLAAVDLERAWPGRGTTRQTGRRRDGAPFMLRG